MSSETEPSPSGPASVAGDEHPVPPDQTPAANPTADPTDPSIEDAERLRSSAEKALDVVTRHTRYFDDTEAGLQAGLAALAQAQAAKDDIDAKFAEASAAAKRKGASEATKASVKQLEAIRGTAAHALAKAQAISGKWGRALTSSESRDQQERESLYKMSRYMLGALLIVAGGMIALAMEQEYALRNSYHPDPSTGDPRVFCFLSMALAVDALHQSALLRMVQIVIGSALAVLGAVLVVRGAQASYSLRAGSGGATAALRTSSPGLVLISLAAAIVVVANYSPLKFDYEPPGACFPASTPSSEPAPAWTTATGVDEPVAAEGTLPPPPARSASRAPSSATPSEADPTMLPPPPGTASSQDE